MSKDYYAILGVSHSADEKEIKSAYRKLARRWHPDVNPNDKTAESKFKEISAAYEVLSDPEKRKMYDQFGSNWENISQAGGAGDFHFQGGGGGFETIFEQFFGAKTGGTGFNFGGVGHQQVEASDVEKVVELTLEEIDEGTHRTLTYHSPDACKSCDGTGVVHLRASRECVNCGGTGRGKGIFGGACAVCGGTGRNSMESCPTCKGAGTMQVLKKVEIKIPAGFPEGKKLRVPGKGVAGTGHRAGDLYVSVKVRPHPLFQRSGDVLETEVEVPYTVAALGGEIKVPTLRSKVTMRIPPGAQSGQKFRLANQGIASLNGGRGDLMAKVKITVPKSLSAEERKLLEQLKELQTA